MKFRRLTFPLILSALPAVVMLVLWVRSHWVSDSAWWNLKDDARAVVLSNGKLEVFLQQIKPTAPFHIIADRGHHAQKPSDAHPAQSNLPTAWEHLGFGYAAGTDEYAFKRIIVVPWWLPAAVVGALPIRWVFWRRKRHLARLRAENRCVYCGYSLRGNTSGACPECGSPCEALRA
ncbi:MAG TPA: hypothetical protein VG269_27325 [Tepidisphaeraceae bacterium]|jgi:hypothetical protein|nr:hypothetical protein [Tepidisphaeraceae bacterium]